MKSKINSILLLITLFTLVLATSCRSESDELIKAPDGQSLEANSKIADLILRISMNNGSLDDDIDNSSCFNIKLPFTITANGQEITFSTQEDLEAIEGVFEDSDQIAFSFPITLVFSGFSEVLVENTDELDEQKEKCNDNEENKDDDNDDEVECLKFKYPFSASAFDAQSELITTETFENDKDLHLFIENLDSDDITNINFPITIIISDSTEISISDLDNLEDVIEDTVEKGCSDDDDDDDDDGNNDEGDTIESDRFTEILTSQTWEILKYKDNQSNETKNYIDFTFEFIANGVIIIENEETEEIINASWSTSANPSGKILNITFDFGSQSPLDKLNGSWDVKKASENQIKLEQVDSDGVSKDQLFFMEE